MMIGELIDYLRTLDPDDPVAAGIWIKSDVEKCAADLGIALGNDDIAAILDAIHDDHDACHGITWDTIERGICERRPD
jgi:hypothetical protein